LETKRWDAIIDSVRGTAQGLNTDVADARQVIKDIGSAVSNTEKIVIENRESVHAAIEDLHRALGNASRAAGEGADFVSGADAKMAELHRQLLISTQNLERATENLNLLLEKLGQDPARLLFGQPPEPRPVDPEIKGRRDPGANREDVH
jgi:ABC-type transporter Mla subunit MlaD